MSTKYIHNLELVFKEYSNPDKAYKMQAYMKNKFLMFGINAPIRDEIIKPFLLKEYLPAKSELIELVTILWQKPEREYHYFAQILVSKYSKNFIKEDITLFEYMVMNQSWWDTVDFIAVNLMGPYFKLFPSQIIPKTNQWLRSENIWLQRCCLLFQLKYKTELNPNLLSKYINELTGTKEFFINKAIGWSLREYSKTNPEWVITFVENTPLNNLSKREAIKYIQLKLN